MRTWRDAVEARPLSGRRLRVPAFVAAGFLMAILSLVATPAYAASCRTDDVATTAVLAPGETTSSRRTVQLPEGEVTLTAARPVLTGDLGPYLSVSLRWCAGSGCSPQRELVPGGAERVTASSVTLEQVVTLAPEAQRTAASGTVRSRVSLGSDACGRAVAAESDSVGGISDGGLPATGGTLVGAAWGGALVAVGGFLWMAGRGRGRAES